jgi:alpha-ribazole phosphatase
MQVIMIRHGETIWSSERRYQGISNVPLSEEGRRKLKPADFSPSRVFVTPLVRTRETAEILFPGAEQIIVPGLSEMNFGIFEGKNYRELNGNPAYQAWMDSGCLAACPGGESKADFSRRVCGAFEELMAGQIAGEDVVIVAHGGTLMAALEAFGRPAREYFDWHADCGCGFRMDAGEWACGRVLQYLDAIDFRGEL